MAQLLGFRPPALPPAVRPRRLSAGRGLPLTREEPGRRRDRHGDRDRRPPGRAIVARRPCRCRAGPGQLLAEPAARASV